MPSESTGPARTRFDLKSAQLSVVALVLKGTDTQQLLDDLAQQLGSDPDFFDNDPLLIDLSAVGEDPAPIDFPALIAALRRYHTQPVAVRGGSQAQRQAAREAGLILAAEAPRGPQSSSGHGVREVEVIREVEVVREVPVPATCPTTMIIDKPLRSGQRVYARNSDVIVLAMVSFGAEVIADGNVHVYAPLRGRVLAGAQGDTSARIYSTCLEPQLVSIAGIYRTVETTLPENVHGKSAMVRLEGDKLLFEPL